MSLFGSRKRITGIETLLNYFGSHTHPSHSVGIFHNRNPSNLDSSDQRIRLFCDLNLNLDYESVDLPLQCPWITHNSL